MLFWRRMHLYLGFLFAPALIIFAISGTCSYTASAIMSALSAVHKDSHLPGKPPSAYTPLRSYFVLAAAGLVFTTLIGVIMAFRFAQSAMVPPLCLGARLLIPTVILAIYHRGALPPARNF